VHMLMDMGIETGVDLVRLLKTGRLMEHLVGHPLASQVSRAGPRWAGGPLPDGSPEPA
jgi:hydroxymethylglutaryl-CoA lyase